MQAVANPIQPIRENVFLVNKTMTEVETVQIAFTTLWSRISETRATQIATGVNDFYKISVNGQPFTVSHFNALHDQALEFLDLLQFNPKSKRIIVTHHVPTLTNYPRQYLHSPINEAFVTELRNVIETVGADYWIYGHHHASTRDFKLGPTCLVTNQLGYVQLDEHFDFEVGRYIVL